MSINEGTLARSRAYKVDDADLAELVSLVAEMEAETQSSTDTRTNFSRDPSSDLVNQIAPPQQPKSVSDEVTSNQHNQRAHTPQPTRNLDTLSQASSAVSEKMHSTQPKCRLCHGYHALHRCSQFLQLSLRQRLRVVSLLNYCSNCLAHCYSRSDCVSERRCQVCNEKHHTLLHSDRPANSQHSRKSSACTSPVPISVPDGQEATAPRVVNLRPTAVVKLVVHDGYHLTRAVIDVCNPQSIVTARLVQSLLIPTIKINNSLVCTLVLRNKYDLSVGVKICARVDSQILIVTPSTTVDECIKKHFTNVGLADPEFYKADAVDLVLGVGVYAKILRRGLAISSAGLPVGQNTIFGYVLSGSCPLKLDLSSTLTSTLTRQ